MIAAFSVLVAVLALAVIGLLKMLRFATVEANGLRAQNKALEDSIPVQRKAAVRKSRAVNTGLITQDIAPLLPDWPFALKDTRPVGHPLDFIVFDGMENDQVERIVFVEVKSGNSRVSARQRQIMKAVEEGRVAYQVYTPAATADDTEVSPGEDPG
jgi:predicted Holliday junction resolvase-like endonuclease